MIELKTVSNEPKRVQRKLTKGYRMPPNTKSVTRPYKCSNPYKIGDKCVWGIKRQEWDGKSLCDILIDKHGEAVYHTVEETILGFREKIRASQTFRRIIKRELKGKNLACFCSLDSPCDADVLLEYANEPCTGYGYGIGFLRI